MANKWLNSRPGNPTRGLDIVRITIAIILAVHGFHGLFNPKAMAGFGGYLSSIGFPFGVAFAWSVVFIQIISSAALIANRFVVAACIGHMVILGVGVFLEHARHGWFVVGAGRNGMEYSITLIACLFAILYAYWPRGFKIKV